MSAGGFISSRVYAGVETVLMLAFALTTYFTPSAGNKFHRYEWLHCRKPAQTVYV